MPFTGDTFSHLFDWEKDPQRQEKIINARLEAEFDGVDTGLSAVAARVTVLEAGGGTRELLSAARTYYVATSGGGGSDSNDGLTSGTPFLTIQKAVNVIAETLDIGGQTVTVQVADGTYTGAVTLKNVVGFGGAGGLKIIGNSSTPANVLINVTGSCFVASSLNVIWDIEDLKLQATQSGIVAVNATVRFNNLNFGAMTNGSHLLALNGGKILKRVFATGYTVSGNVGTSHANAGGAGSTINVDGGTITLSGTPTFIYWFLVTTLGEVGAQGITYSGSGTGTEYLVVLNGVLNTNGALATIPGATTGSTATGGQVA